MEPSQLIQRALEARANAYAPYSHFTVGAALLTEENKIYSGCNVENVSYGLSCCAERNAFFQAISHGEKSFSAIALVGGNESLTREELSECLPCGACLQVMAEFCNPKTFRILLAHSLEIRKEYKLIDLLPSSFKLL